MQHGSRHPAVWLAATVAACGSGSAGLGDNCDGNGDCGDGLQCISHVCVAKCQRAPECGDGFSCDASGYCRVAAGQPGDTCVSEVDCTAGLSCQIDGLVDGNLHASCATENAGGPAGATCAMDDDCRDGTCALGRCVDLCRDTRDCGVGTTCTRMPRVEANGAMFDGCLQSQGTLAWSIPTHGPTSDVFLPIPESARSVAVTFAIAAQNQMVGATIVTAPDGTLVVDPTVDYYSRLVRHQPALGQSVLAMPSSPATPLQAGMYKMHVTSIRPPFGLGLPGTNTPTTTAVVKLDDGILLDLHFYFLNFEAHPCSDAFGGASLDAKLAGTASFFQHDFVGELRAVFSNGDVALGTMTYEDVLDHPELDGLDVGDVASLLSLGRDGLGVNVFFVRTLSPVGLQAFGPPGPGPAGIGGTSQSGIVIGLDTLCYRSWSQLARITAHEIARYMGLYNNVELAHDDWTDPIDHGTTGATNLMFYSEFGGTDLSAGQQQILSRSVVLR
jgi:hypothetical protein